MFTILPPVLLFLLLSLLGKTAAEGYGGMRYPVDGWEQERRPSQWRLRQWRPISIGGQATRFLRRQTRSIDSSIGTDAVTAIDPDWEDPLFGNSASALLKELAKEDDEPLVISRYNRDCFFTPVNCFVGRAGQQATNIVGSASNSKRQILFIKRRNRKNQRGQRKAKKAIGAASFL